MTNAIRKAVLLAGVNALAMTTLAVMPANPQQSHWADDNDPTAKYMIEMERQWAEAGCSGKSVGQFLAEDFQGTAPDGSRYDKKKALENDGALHEHECRLDEAKVRFFGDQLALIYGSERALRKPPNGPEAMRCLVWTDTWLKRDGKWQIVAAQDTAVPCK
jgi:hypothetical protein